MRDGRRSPLKILFLIMPALFFTFASGCGADEKIIRITEKMYVGQVGDIYLNAPDYSGKLVTMAGMCEVIEYRGKPAHIIYRNAPGGCCGNDNIVGFLFEWNGPIPKKSGTWIEVTGRVKVEKIGIENEVKLILTSLKTIAPQKSFVK